LVGVCVKGPVADAVRPKGLGLGGGPSGSVSQWASLVFGRSASISFHTKNAIVAVRNSKPRGSLENSLNQKNPSDATASDGLTSTWFMRNNRAPEGTLSPYPFTYPPANCSRGQVAKATSTIHTTESSNPPTALSTP
jgi:hypothetical protein